MTGSINGNGAGPSAGAPVYSDRDRKRDRRRGIADAKRHLPLVPQRHALGQQAGQLALPDDGSAGAGRPDSAVSVTPFLYELFNRRKQDLAALYKAYLGERNQLLNALREADGRCQQLLHDQGVAQDQIERLTQPLSQEDASRRTYGEAKVGHPEELVRRRRLKEREKEGGAAQKRLDAISHDLNLVTVAAGNAQGALATKLAEVQASGTEIVAYYEQRKASYISGLTHKHRRNVELLERLNLADPGRDTAKS